VEASVAETGGAAGLEGIVDAKSITAAHPRGKHPMELYCERVLRDCDVRVTHQTMQLASYICGLQGVAGLPYVDKATVAAQAKKIAERADRDLNSAMVIGPLATKLATRAIELRLAGEAPANPEPGEFRAAAEFAAQPDQDDE
jgi:hypothetical protein